MRVIQRHAQPGHRAQQQQRVLGPLRDRVHVRFERHAQIGVFGGLKHPQQRRNRARQAVVQTILVDQARRDGDPRRAQAGGKGDQPLEQGELDFALGRVRRVDHRQHQVEIGQRQVEFIEQLADFLSLGFGVSGCAVGVEMRARSQIDVPKTQPGDRADRVFEREIVIGPGMAGDLHTHSSGRARRTFPDYMPAWPPRPLTAGWRAR